VQRLCQEPTGDVVFAKRLIYRRSGRGGSVMFSGVGVHE